MYCIHVLEKNAYEKQSIIRNSHHSSKSISKRTDTSNLVSHLLGILKGRKLSSVFSLFYIIYRLLVTLCWKPESEILLNR